jgi:hypothetical protein
VREEIYQAFELIYPVLSGMCNLVCHLLKTCANRPQISARSRGSQEDHHLLSHSNLY